MKRFAKVLFSLVLISLPFSGHSFQASDTATNTHQISLTKVGWFGDSSDLKHFYPSYKDAPNYPKGFKNAKNGITRNSIKDKVLLHDLRKEKKGKWFKVYRDGVVDGKKVSLHYFAHQSGSPVFDVKFYYRWSNQNSRI
ncbi:hypothetical protein PSI23_13980 [Xenorhabdus sp. XENO-10]|uniref:Uncharacterized protein n=1 Tax=Xenorhabdus yunnanensis TaxID=3025878 RepID=A0ABT5LKU2_9GAMM|nr:hypothetical protein [Xenorhabdus yunnanensis]MDC9590370.1 hypothetical protein [Xenorhabdus yunnanensis]